MAAAPPRHLTPGRCAHYDDLTQPLGRSGRSPIIRRSAFAAVLLALALSANAFAADVPKLTGAITDQVGALDGRTDEITTALDQVLAEHHVQLFVLFVATTGDLTVTDFADETAKENSLGADDALLLVAMDDRTDAIWVSNALPITDAEINDVISGTLEPGLRSGDFATAVIDAANALGQAADPSVPGPVPTVDVGGGGGVPGGVPGGGIPQVSDSGVGTLVGIVIVALLLVALAVWLASRFGARITAWRESEERDRRTGQLARQANAGLIATDDRIRNADQEAGFVEAQFGTDEAAPFKAAVAAARDELRGAFEVRQRLDDAQPEDPPTREAMLQDIVARVGRAGSALDAQAARIDELRNLERQAPTILAALPAQVAALEARLPQATSSVHDLTTTYAEPVWAAVKGNVTEARKGLAGARAAIAQGTTAVASAGGAGVAHQIVVAQQGIAGAAALLDAIDTTARTVRDTAAGLGGQLAAAEADLAAARDARATEPKDAAARHDAAFAAAEAAVATARTAAAVSPPDPMAAGKAVAAAARATSDLLAATKQDVAEAERFAAALGATLTAAHAEVDRAGDFIATRRGGVQREARTRLAEAERLLSSAEAKRTADPKGALADAQQADKLAEEAYSLATADFDRWDRTGRGTGVGVGGGGNLGGDIGGAILGGIIGGMLGGGRGAGWGGSPWGSSGGSGGGVFGGGGGGGVFGGGGGWGGGHSAGGGFGGFGGGRFGGGGGGGHSGGGHW